MICLKNRTFAVSQTSNPQAGGRPSGLWFAWKIVLLQYHKHLIDKYNKAVCVVICLKNRTFAVSQTSYCTNIIKLIMLWFAWKIVLLQYHKHLSFFDGAGRISCDLLEKSYFCSITNIFRLRAKNCKVVVICLKNRTFAVSQTSNVHFLTNNRELWFAWKIVLLQYHKHQNGQEYVLYVCCDLLEKSYFCSITNILWGVWIHWFWLWFAWKIVLLQYHKHRKTKQIIIGTVVICLKNRTFAVSQTSKNTIFHNQSMLWFAWKIVLLQYHKHH